MFSITTTSQTDKEELKLKLFKLEMDRGPLATNRGNIEVSGVKVNVIIQVLI